jgi:hypothetical protein
VALHSEEVVHIHPTTPIDMTSKTKKELIESEIQTLSVLSDRLRAAITLFDAEDDDITDLDKATALAKENREVLSLIAKHQQFLSDALKLPIDQD